MTQEVAKAQLQFQGAKTDNLFMKYTLSLPCYQSELDEFLKEAKRFGGKEVQLAPNLTAVFERGGTVKGQIVGDKMTTVFNTIEDAIDTYFKAPDGETYVGEDPTGESEGDLPDGANQANQEA